MTSRFLFSIWSDIERFWSHTFDDLHRTFKDEGKLGSGITGQELIRELNGLVYCYDYKTLALANNLGLDTLRIPDAEYMSTEGRYCRKLLTMHHALQTYSEVCHLDLDVVLVRPLPEDFWEQLRQGMSLQAPIMKHNRRKARWRDDEDSQKYWLNACYMFCDNPKVAERCVQVMHDNPGWYEEGVLGYVIDEMHGGWKGAKGYVQDGYNPPGIWQLRGTHNSPEPWFVHNNKM